MRMLHARLRVEDHGHLYTDLVIHDMTSGWHDLKIAVSLDVAIPSFSVLLKHPNTDAFLPLSPAEFGLKQEPRDIVLTEVTRPSRTEYVLVRAAGVLRTMS